MKYLISKEIDKILGIVPAYPVHSVPSIIVKETKLNCIGVVPYITIK